MEVKYVDHMGTDLSVVNAARVSFDKFSEWGIDEETAEKILKLSDEKLIKYLAEHNHWTPFGHVQISLHLKAPIFVARQLVKHQIGFVWNEVSRRYVATEPEFFMPESWRLKADNVKQGSSSLTIERFTAYDGCLSVKESFLDEIMAEDCETDGECDTCGDTRRTYTYTINSVVEHVHERCREAYNLLLEEGVCPEQARMILPLSMYTEWHWTGSLAAYARACKLRLDPHSQLETRLIAEQISSIIKPLYPVSWEALMQ
jgi:thymidylate synthase (FAD)